MVRTTYSGGAWATEFAVIRGKLVGGLFRFAQVIKVWVSWNRLAALSKTAKLAIRSTIAANFMPMHGRSEDHTAGWHPLFRGLLIEENAEVEIVASGVDDAHRLDVCHAVGWDNAVNMAGVQMALSSPFMGWAFLMIGLGGVGGGAPRGAINDWHDLDERRRHWSVKWGDSVIMERKTMSKRGWRRLSQAAGRGL